MQLFVKVERDIKHDKETVFSELPIVVVVKSYNFFCDI